MAMEWIMSKQWKDGSFAPGAASSVLRIDTDLATSGAAVLEAHLVPPRA